MLIPKYEMKRISGGCDDDAQTVSIQATIQEDISPAYPLVNALLPGCAYNHSGKVLSWQEGSHKVVLRARELAISNVSTWTEAAEAMGSLVQYLNEVWERRAELVPREQAHPQATPLAVYKLLPNTNCRLCGQPTCYSFALQLMARQTFLDACPPLSEPQHGAQLVELQAILVPPPSVLFRGP